MAGFIYMSALELAELIRTGKATSTEIVTAHLEQIRKHNSNLNAVVILLEEEALKTAARCDEEAARGEFRGPLHGVPMTIKEQFWLKGVKATINFKMLRDWTAPEDAVIVKRLRDAGAVIMGKTNVPKNLTDYQVYGDIYPEGKNPYNPEYSPGGSSGGSSAALASGMTPIELGGDFGGSIRNPSHFCGLYGMKPTEKTIPGHGMVPRPESAKGFVFHMAQAGPMARDPYDMELVWNLIKGPFHGDKNTPRIAWQDSSKKALRDYRIAWVDRWPAYETSESTQKLIQDFTALLAQHNVQTANAEPVNNLHERSLAVWARLFSQLLSQNVPRFVRPLMKMQMKSSMLKGQKKFLREFNQGFKDRFTGYSQAMGVRAEVISEWEAFFEGYDLLVCPMAFGPAFKRCRQGSKISYDGRELIYLDYVWPFVACFNATGHPAMNVPLGIGPDGLPVGVQVVGPYWSEPDMIRFVQLISEFTPGFIRPEGY